MSMNTLQPGISAPDDLNVVIEIPANSDPVKYEVDKDTGLLHVDRFSATSMVYPFNYGFVPNTLCDDGDPLDMMVLAPFPICHGAVIRVRPIGVLMMTDEAGQDPKILAVPVSKLSKAYESVTEPEHLPKTTIRAIEHFFAHYKDLDEGKWVKIEGWKDASYARQVVVDSISACHN